MALVKPSPDAAPADNYARIAAAFDRIDALGADQAQIRSDFGQEVAQESSDRQSAVQAETEARDEQVGDLAIRVGTTENLIAAAGKKTDAAAVDTATRLKGLSDRADGTDRAIGLLRQDGDALRDTVGPQLDTLETLLGTAALVPRDRVGENLFLFTPRLDGLSAACPPLPAGTVTVTGAGQVVRLTGAQSVARRAATWLEPGRVHALRWIFDRFSKPSDPDDDRIRCGVACLDANGRLIAALIAKDYATVDPASGLQVLTVRFPSQAGDAIALQPPAGTVLFRPFVQTFGLDGVTDLVLIAEADITDAGSFSPDVSALQGQIAALQQAVAQLSPLAAGVANGLATLDGSGTVMQLPMLKAAWLAAAAQAVPGALELVDNAIANQADENLSIAHRAPFVQAGDAWSVFAQATLGLSDAQVATILAAIGSPSQRAGFTAPNPVFDLDITTAAVIRAARARFALIAGASMKNFVATKVGDEDAADDSFAAYWLERHAPVGGILYGLLLSYLITPAPGPALSQQAAVAHLTAIWSAAATLPL